MERSPLVLQAALLLIGYALSDHLCINQVVVSILIGLTAFGPLFYILIISAPNTQPDSLQQCTYLNRTERQIGYILSQGKKLLRRKPSGSH